MRQKPSDFTWAWGGAVDVAFAASDDTEKEFIAIYKAAFVDCLAPELVLC